MVITIIGGILIVILLLTITVLTTKERKKALLELMAEKFVLQMACAGTCDDVVPPTKTVTSLKIKAFRNSDGDYLTWDDYEHFIVQGDSMQFCGINNSNLIFVDDKFKIQDCGVFPVILLLQRHNTRKDSVQFKIRRTWDTLTYKSKETLLERIKDIISSDKFQEVRQLDVYDGDSALMEDLKNTRIPMYEREYIFCKDANDYDRKIIISTTYHTKERKIRFSLHPISMIKGKVIASFEL